MISLQCDAITDAELDRDYYFVKFSTQILVRLDVMKL